MIDELIMKTLELDEAFQKNDADRVADLTFELVQAGAWVGWDENGVIVHYPAKEKQA